MRYRSPDTAVLCGGLALLLGLAACGRPTAEEEASGWLSHEIERPESVPAATDPSAPPALDADGILLATFFPIPRTFISRGLDSGHPQDPFAIVQEGVEAHAMRLLRSADGESALYLEERLVGTTIEVEAFVSTDGRTIDLNFALEFHTAPPDSVATDREGDSEGGVPARATLFHAKKVTTQLILPDGGTRLIASWTPTGKPEFGQFGQGETRTLVFLAANIQRK